MERVNRSVNAGLTALMLMTSADMPREVYVEEVIERTVQTVRYQLFNCIYPEFDPAYRVENTAKGELYHYFPLLSQRPCFFHQD